MLEIGLHCEDKVHGGGSGEIFRAPSQKVAQGRCVAQAG